MGKLFTAYLNVTRLTSTSSWDAAQPLYTGGATDAPYGPIDQTVIADDKNMYLFFAGDNGDIYRSIMPLGDFPGSFGNVSETILTDTVENLFEAVQVYKLKGQSKWLMIGKSELGQCLPLVEDILTSRSRMPG
jgi:hypothetical protein